MKNLLWVLLALCFAALFWWWQQASTTDAPERGARPPVPVTTYIVEPRQFSDQASALGSLRSWESVDISASVSQKIASINFEDGQQVAGGDVLARLKQDAEQATLRELQATLAEAKRELRRLENLARQNQVAQNELDKARTQEEVTRHQIDQVKARIADRTIVAPFDGVLGLRLVSEGALVTPGQQLTTLDDISRMRLEFSVPATLLGFLQTGQVVEATAPAFSKVFEGEILAVNPRIDPVARSVTALAVLDNANHQLRPGLLMEVTVKGDAREALLLPEESLESRSTQHYVWRVEQDTAQRVAVEIGSRIPGWVEITAGLAAGDEVVRDGVGRLRGDSASVTRVAN
tara:strand:- start:68326 stop:69366 length:1041 start_codon:yes stop_codon:yes gene_type:complete